MDEQPSGCMYVETIVGGKKLQAMVDMGVDTVYIARELANKIHLPYKKERGYVKGVNTKSLPIHVAARGTDIRIRPCKGKINITIACLYDRNFYLGMNFLDRAKPSIVLYANTLFITTTGQAHLILMRWDSKKERVLPAL